jgi:hypothetical protein
MNMSDINMDKEYRKELRELKNLKGRLKRENTAFFNRASREYAQACKERVRVGQMFERDMDKLNRRMAILEGRLS